jgi:hypothetical protein
MDPGLNKPLPCLLIRPYTDRSPQNFVVDINGPFTALLPQLSFEGATKRNRPNIKAGDVVYARVAMASRDMDPILTCVDAAGRPLHTCCAFADGTSLLLQIKTALAELNPKSFYLFLEKGKEFVRSQALHESVRSFTRSMIS